MQLSRDSPELMATFRDYAANLGPTPQPEYKVIHDWNPWVQVPPGHLPIRIAQFARGDHRSNCKNRLHHWAIFIPTSTRRGVGNFYDIGGSMHTRYFVQHVVNNRHPRWGEERGSHLVGWVAPTYLETLETHFLLFPIEKRRPDWNCQIWVVEALRGLDQSHMYAVQMDYDQWSRQMEIVEKAWDIGDA